MNRLVILSAIVILASCDERKEVEIRINKKLPQKSEIKNDSVSQSILSLKPATSFNTNLQGKWKIVKYAISENATVQKEEAESWLNKEAEFTDNSISLNGEICEPVLIESTVVSPEDFFVDEFETNAEHLGILNEKVEVFSMECDYPITDILLLDDTTSLMASNNGLFFTLEKQP